MPAQLLIEQRYRAQLLIGRSAEHEHDDVLWLLILGRLVRLEKRVAGLAQAALEKQIKGLGQVGRMLRVNVLDALHEHRA